MTLKQVGEITNSQLQLTTNRPLPTGSFIPKSYKYNLLFTLLHRAFKLCSNFELFHQEIYKLKTISENNGHPKSFVDLCLKKYLDKAFTKKEVVLKGFKSNLFASFFLLEKKSLQLRTHLVNSIKSNIKLWNREAIFQSLCKLNSLFHYKDSLKKKIHSNTVYRYTCSNCKVTDYGKTYHHFFGRAAEHTSVPNLTEKFVKSVKKTSNIWSSTWM